MSDLYDLEAEGGWTSPQTQVATPGVNPGPTEREWRDAYMPRRSAQVAERAGYEVNPTNGHALDCGCTRCPGWYEARARMAVAAQAYSEPVVKPVASRPLYDQVVPVAILMVVFTMCMAVLLPIITPMLALGAVSLALVAVSLVVVVVAALGFMIFVMRAKREAGPKIVPGKVLRRR